MIRLGVAVAVAAVVWPSPGIQAREAGTGSQPAAVAAAGPGKRAVLDNPSVAVTRLTFAAGAREDTHTHSFPVLIVQVTGGELTVMDREMTRVGGRSGEVWFVPAGTPHAIANRTANAIDVLQVALKPDRAPAPAAPATTAPEGIARSTLVDNGDARVVRVRFEPSGREPVHTHPNDLLTIQITRGKVEMLEGTSRTTEECEPGYVRFLARNVAHSYASADTQPFELLSVSIK